MRSFRDALTLLVLLLLVLSVRVAPLTEAMDSLIPEANASEALPAPESAPLAERPLVLPASLDTGMRAERREIHAEVEHGCRMLEASISAGENGEGRVIFVLELDAEGMPELDIESIEIDSVETDEPFAWSAGKAC